MNNLFKRFFKKNYVFFDKDDNEIKYIEYIKDKNMLKIENENGFELIPAEGLRMEII